MAKPLRLALGACIIQAEYGYSDEETALQIQEDPYLQYFCGHPGYDDEKLPFAPSLMVYFRKRLTSEVLGEINEMIVRDAKERQVKEAESKDDDDDSDGQPGTGGNSGTMIVDATCAPSNIRYPQTRPGRTPKRFWMFFTIPRTERSLEPTANAPGKIT